MWRVLLSLCLLSLLPGFSQGVQAQTVELDTMFFQALNNLESSASKIESLQKDLSASRDYVESLQNLSLAQKRTLQTQMMTLDEQSRYLSSINEQLMSISDQLLRTKIRLAYAIKIVVVLGALCVLRLLLFVVGMVFYIKGVRVPRWVDIVL